jgi:phosphate-selective porin OprO/OprP
MKRGWRSFSWLCSAGLLCGSAALASEPNGAPELPDVRVDRDFSASLEQLRQRLDRLEAENQQLKQSRAPLAPTEGVTPANAEMWNSAYPNAAAPANDSKPGSDWSINWKNGVWFESKDKAFKLHVGGRTQVDAAWVNAEDDVQFGAGGIGAADDAVNFRRGRFAMEGLVWDTVEFNMEWDFINTFNASNSTGDVAVIANTPVPTDLWIGLVDVPVLGHLRVGNQKPPISFEHMTSSRFLNFMERSLAFDSFIESGDNGFRPGIMAFDNWDGDRGVWQLGFFKNNSGFQNLNNGIFGWNVGDGEYDVTGRLTYLPWASDDNRCLLHVGLGVSHRSLDDGVVRYRSRDSIRNGPAALHNIVAQAQLFGDQQTLLVPELVMNYESWTVQAEYQASWTYNATERFPIASAAPLGTVFFQGGYAEVLYFLTGEHRAYDRKNARFDRVVPYNNFSWKTGCWGAWQLAARYSRIDLKDDGVDGSVVDDFTAGLNWFLNPNTKVQFNYAIAFATPPATPATGRSRKVASAWRLIGDRLSPREPNASNPSTNASSPHSTS